jgi:hypothetical protein
MLGVHAAHAPVSQGPFIFFGNRDEIFDSDPNKNFIG